MKVALFIGIIVIIIPKLVSSTTNRSITSVNRRGLFININDFTPNMYQRNTSVQVKSSFFNKTEILFYRVINKLRNFWNQDENSFTGRCIGLAKRIRSLLPVFVFKMGVIMTLLGFLTLFSMKSLGMLALLLIINTSGAVAKLTAAAFSYKDKKPPSTVHFHVHKDNDYHGGYHIGHTSPGHDWDRKSRLSQDLTDLDRLESYNLYNKLLQDLSLNNYRM